MKHLGDITQIRGWEVPVVDIVTGGSPCQDLSVAGNRAGLDGERSGLFMEQIRIIKEMREHDRRTTGRSDEFIRPRYMVWENVPGAFSSNKGEDFRCVLEETARIAQEDAVIPRLEEQQKWTPSGCIMGNGWSIAWRVHDAQFWGVPQRRKRIALVADFGGLSAPEILFERESVSGDSETSGNEGKSSAGNFGSSTEKTSRTCVGLDVYNHAVSGDVAVTLNATSGISITHSGPSVMVLNDQDGSQMSESYSVAYSTQACGDRSNPSQSYMEETAYTIASNPMSDRGQAVAYRDSKRNCVVLENHPTDSRIKICEDNTFQSLTSRMGTGGNNVPLVMESINGDICGTPDASYYKGCGERQGVEREVVCVGNGQVDQLKISSKVGALNCMHDQQAIMCQSVVRRLTPLECERLQNFPDGWTDIGDWVDSKGKKHRGDADSPRYKALGNSIALPFWQWMADRIVAQYDRPTTMASLFDGIGGFCLVFSRSGCTPVWASEIEEFCIAVTKKRFPEEEEDE